jgi:hypothetical protein
VVLIVLCDQLWLREVFGLDLFNFWFVQLYFAAQSMLSGGCYMLARLDLDKKCLVSNGCVIVVFFTLL